MPSKLGIYILVRTLGSGTSSKVKYAFEIGTKKPYAIKIMRKEQMKQQSIELLQTEVKIIQALSHKNVIDVIEYNMEGIQEKQDGRKIKVLYIVLELIDGGCLFDYILESGAFSEKVARYYFRQMIEAMYYVHSKGIVHRDLKPENILLDNQFNLKIADFGFAAPLAGKDGSFLLNTCLGSKGYAAPEILLGKPYHGNQVDLFACGVILFNMVTKYPPFQNAHINDKHYKLIATSRSDQFWYNHCMILFQNINYLSMELKDLITHMIQQEPVHRLSIQEILAHPWYQMDVPSYQEICEEFQARKIQLEKDAQLQEIKQQQIFNALILRQKYRTVYKSVGQKDSNQLPEFDLNMGQYIPSISTKCELFFNQSPGLLYQAILNYLEQKGMIGEEVGKDQQKLLILAQDDDQNQIYIVCRLLKVNEKTTCMQFSKRVGEQFQFYEQFQKIKKYFNELSQ